MLTLILDVHGPDGTDIDAALLKLDYGAIRRIQQLARAVQDLNVYKIVEFSYAPEPMEEDIDADWVLVDDQHECEQRLLPQLRESEIRIDGVCLNVKEDGFFWSGYVKHTDLRWETSSVPLSVLDLEGRHDLRAG